MMIEVGEYIRTTDGRIAKCIDIYMEEDARVYVFDNIVFSAGFHNDYNEFYESEIKSFTWKHSKNIFDLIEVGDYVNRELVIGFGKSDIGRRYFLLNGKLARWYENNKQRIKAILTHEQYEKYCYEVKEKNVR